MKMLWGVVGAVVLSVGCGPDVGSAQREASVPLSTEGNVSAMGDEGGGHGGGECPDCSVKCGPHGDKVRICHHAPPDEPGSKAIELCIAAPGAAAHLREHDEDRLGCCPKGH
ncbi:hypothetical protein D7V93_13460 [Corallococcus llansteffanensis]|uniref:Uncharacterized protein n=2 Tax=Corallococcus llansteffanensis TaxID=2316731 RepID=A0A3A8PV71_9BACT|nr:hypothetical protein D7V93_13460 [Corallococcus llansteffanensis]